MRGPASLTSRLVITAVGLVVVVAVLIGVVATTALRANLVHQLDDDLRAIAGVRAGFGDGPGPGVPPAGVPELERRGGPDTLTAVLDEDPSGRVNTGRDDFEPLSESALDELAELPTDGGIHEVDVPGFGEYRVIAVERSFGTELTGLPSAAVDEPVQNLVAVEAVLVGIGALVATAGGLLLVRRQLRPLREVAATAHAVAALPLAEGDIDLA